MSKAMPSLPEDMVAEILSLLPVESLLRFNCVCKEWRQLIQQDDFVQKHHRRASMCFYYHQKYINQPFPFPRMIRKDEEFTCIDIQKGLLLEHEHRCQKNHTERLSIKNPVTRKTVYLPDLLVGNELPTWVVARMFFVAKSCKECKVLSFSESEESVFLGRFRAVTVGVDAAWRPLKNSPPNSVYSISKAGQELKIYALSIENIFYVVTMETHSKKILWVDPEDESIKTAEIPENLFSNWKYVIPREWNSKLSLFNNSKGVKINIWVLMNNNKNEWAKTQTVDVANFTVDYPIPFITEEKKIWTAGINGKQWGLHVPWHSKKEELNVKPTVLQLKGMQSDKVEEAIGARFWTKRDLPKTTSQIISVISLERLM